MFILLCVKENFKDTNKHTHYHSKYTIQHAARDVPFTPRINCIQIKEPFMSVAMKAQYFFRISKYNYFFLKPGPIFMKWGQFLQSRRHSLRSTPQLSPTCQIRISKFDMCMLLFASAYGKINIGRIHVDLSIIQFLHSKNSFTCNYLLAVIVIL